MIRRCTFVSPSHLLTFLHLYLLTFSLSYILTLSLSHFFRVFSHHFLNFEFDFVFLLRFAKINSNSIRHEIEFSDKQVYLHHFLVRIFIAWFILFPYYSNQRDSKRRYHKTIQGILFKFEN